MSANSARPPQVRQAVGKVKANPIGLPAQATKEIVSRLNTDVSSLYVLFHQYRKHYWVSDGPQYSEVHDLLATHLAEADADASQIAERLVSLGGVPVSAPARQAKAAYVKHEEEGVLWLRDMLAHDMAAEQQVIVNLRAHLQAARELTDFGTEKLLKGVLERAEVRAQNLEHLLDAETLDAELLAPEAESNQAKPQSRVAKGGK